LILRAAALIWAEEAEVGWAGGPGREEGEKVAEQALWLLLL
jgi:hypothetical protein